MSLVLGVLTRQHLNELPPVIAEDPDIQAVVQVYALEAERLSARLDLLRANLFVQTADELGLPFLERQLRITVNPVGQTVVQRRETILALLKAVKASGEGSDWVRLVDGFVGQAGWTYQEHVEGDPTSPPMYTVRVNLPFAPSGNAYEQVRSRIREVTPAHIALVFSSTGGFLLDQSQMDQEILGT